LNPPTQEKWQILLTDLEKRDLVSFVLVKITLTGGHHKKRTDGAMEIPGLGLGNNYSLTKAYTDRPVQATTAKTGLGAIDGTTTGPDGFQIMCICICESHRS